MKGDAKDEKVNIIIILIMSRIDISVPILAPFAVNETVAQ